jgi:hypothetical protein
VHHSHAHIDWLEFTRPPGGLIFTRFCGLVPMYALGMASPMDGGTSTIPLLIMFLGPIWGFFIHANVRWRLVRFEVADRDFSLPSLASR